MQCNCWRYCSWHSVNVLAWRGASDFFTGTRTRWSEARSAPWDDILHVWVWIRAWWSWGDVMWAVTKLFPVKHTQKQRDKSKVGHLLSSFFFQTLQASRQFYYQCWAVRLWWDHPEWLLIHEFLCVCVCSWCWKDNYKELSGFRKHAFSCWVDQYHPQTQLQPAAS